jgi:hypothetical protein
MNRPLILCHIETSSGPRFSIHPTEEHLRQELISYFNEVHADADTEELPDDADLEDVIEAIEEIESLSRETITINPQEFWS